MKRILKFRVRPARLSKVKAKPARYALALIEDIFEKIRPKFCRSLTTRLVVNIEFDEVRKATIYGLSEEDIRTFIDAEFGSTAEFTDEEPMPNFVRYNTPAYIAVFGDEE